MLTVIFLALSLLTPKSLSLENGLARTPPMGWMSWLRFMCETNCAKSPNACISEKLFTSTADLLESEGYAAAGYKYVIVDDCWLANERDDEDRLMPDPERFPRGMKYLANYIHNKGLKFGLYENYGKKTCFGYPGVIDHLKLDAATFASWDVDYVKLDGCNVNIKRLEKGYTLFGSYLNETGRPMVYSCSWPFYLIEKGVKPNLANVSPLCNLWRIYYDINNRWKDVANTMEWFAQNQKNLIPHSGPGHWNDPDQLVIGNQVLSVDQSKLQMAIWAILAAPLIMSNDLRTVTREEKEILQNKEVIAINQDPLGIQGQRIKIERFISVWVRPVTPVGETHSYAVAFCNLRDDQNPRRFAMTLRSIGLTNRHGYKFKDLYGDEIMYLSPNDTITGKVNPSGVVFYKATVLSE